jgi:hypothetical protein
MSTQTRKRGSFHRLDSRYLFLSVNVQESESTDHLVYSSESHLFKTTKLTYHPLSLIVFTIWTGFIVVLVSVLEYAVQHPSLAFSKYPKVWQQAPGLLITLFAQGHVTVTAWYLGRLGISALLDPRFAPKTWIEMFWMSSDQWQSPVGWIKTLVLARRRHLRLSVTFGAFVVAILFALPAPLLLKRAYTLLPLDIQDTHTYWNHVWSLAPNASNSVDPYTQVTMGQSGWSSGFDANETYPARIYQLKGSSAIQAQSFDDIFFSADVYPGADAVLPGVRTRGGCHVVKDDTDQLLDTNGVSLQSFQDHCARQDLGLQWNFSLTPGMHMSFEMASCYNSHYYDSLGMIEQGLNYWVSSLDSPQAETALIWINVADYTNTTATQGIIQCDFAISTGTAHISADIRSRTRYFEDFQDKKLFTSRREDGITKSPYWPPLFTALSALSLPSVSNTTNSTNEIIVDWELVISKAKMFGFTLSNEKGPGGRQFYLKPSLDAAAASLWSGALHMTAAINVGASTYKQEPLFYRFQVSWWTQDLMYRGLTLGVMAIWLGTIVILTAFLYRPAFASGMDSYTIVRICAERPDLLEDEYTGELGENIKMQERFRPLVADVTTTPQLSGRKGYVSKENGDESDGDTTLLPTLGYREVSVV